MYAKKTSLHGGISNGIRALPNALSDREVIVQHASSEYKSVLGESSANLKTRKDHKKSADDDDDLLLIFRAIEKERKKDLDLV